MSDGFLFGARRFFDSRGYIALVTLCLFLGHATAKEVPFAIFVAALTFLGFLVAESLRFLLPPLLGGVCIVSVAHTPYLPTESDYFQSGARPAVILIGSLFLLSGLTVFLVRRWRDAVPLSSLSLRWGFLAFFAALLFAGLGQENAPRNLAFGAGIGASFFVVYLLFGLFHPKTRENAEHFMFVLLCVGLLVAAELLLLYLRSVTFSHGLPDQGSILIGWGTWTHIGAMLTMCLPAPFCLAREAGRGYPLYLLAGGVITAALLFSASRAAWLYGGGILFLSLLLLCLGGKNRKRSRLLVGLLLFGGAVALLLLLPGVIAFLRAFVGFGDGDNGRFALWRTAVDAFRDAPLFGKGFFDSSITLPFPQILPYLYHNTVLQMLGSAGGVGLALYLFHRALTVRLLWRRRRSALSCFLLLVPLALVLVSLTDEHIFHVYPAFFYTVALSLAEGRYDEPLYEK